MKFEILALVAMLVAVTASGAPTAAEQEAKKRAQAIQQLVKKNNLTVNALRRSVESVWNWHNAKKAKDFASINSNVNEIVRLVTLKEGAANCMTKGDALAMKARAYSDPINLRDYEAAKKVFDEALKAQEDADRRARVAHAYATYLFKCGQEPAADCEKKQLDAYNAPGVCVATRLALLRDGVPGLDYRKEGRRLAEEAKDQNLLRQWYSAVTAPPGWQERDARDPLDPENCAEWRLRTCDEALAKLEPKYHAEFVARKVQIYISMSKWDEAEKVIRAKLAETPDPTDRRRAGPLGELAALYAERAARYYQKPDDALSRKAIGLWEEAIGLDPKNGGPMRKVIERAMLIDDHGLASKWLDAYTAVQKDQKPDAWICAVRGDIAYYRGDYEQAVKWYRTFEKFPDGPTVVKIPNSHQRFAGALYATGRYEECLKALDGCPNFWSFKDTNNHYRRILKEKIQASQGTSKENR